MLNRAATECHSVMRSALPPIIAFAALLAAWQGIAAAEPLPLPRQMTWSAYGTTSTGYVQAIAVSNTLRKFYGTSVRVIPGKNDISRIMPIARKRAEFCACGIAEAYFAQEGITLFATPDWGPQPMRVLFTNRGDGIGHSLVMAGDLGIESLADLAGKRVAWIRGSPALQLNTTAILAFAGRAACSGRPFPTTTRQAGAACGSTRRISGRPW